MSLLTLKKTILPLPAPPSASTPINRPNTEGDRRSVSRQTWMTGTEDGVFFTAGTIPPEVLKMLRDEGVEVEGFSVKGMRMSHNVPEDQGSAVADTDEDESSEARGYEYRIVLGDGRELLLSKNASETVSTTMTAPPPRVLTLFHADQYALSQDNEDEGDVGDASRRLLKKNFLTINWDEVLANGEKAFWGLIMPSISSISTLAEGVSSFFSELSGLSTYLLAGTEPSTHTETFTRALYSEETIYTIRFPRAASPTANRADLENTARPVFVKKRAALPGFETRGSGAGFRIDILGWEGPRGII